MIADIASDLDSIDALNSEFAPALYDKYKSGATLKDVIAYNIALIDAKKREETRKALERVSATEKAETRTEGEYGETEEEQTITVDFRVTCTKTQLTELKNFLNWNNIKYGRVPKG